MSAIQTLSFNVENIPKLFTGYILDPLKFKPIFVFIFFFFSISSATVLAHYKIFWLKLPGPVISQGDATPAPSRSTTVMSTNSASTSILPQPVRANIQIVNVSASLSSITLPFIESILLQFTSEGCGKSKSCLNDPVSCNPSVDTNCFFLSYSTLGQTVSFELSGPAQGYISFALSKDERMVSMIKCKPSSAKTVFSVFLIRYIHVTLKILMFGREMMMHTCA